MSETNKAVFLSYASQDAEAARRICDALRAAGVEVWFDQSELVGGDAWDAKIRKQIRECALFVPVISANTQARAEGYFRREWKLAVERTHDMADHVTFLVPVVLDDTRDREAHVPEAFLKVQWTRLPGGETPPTFAERVRRLLGGEMAPKAEEVGASFDGAPGRPPLDGLGALSMSNGQGTPLRRNPSRPLLVAAVLGVAAVVALAVWRPWRKPGNPSVVEGNSPAGPAAAPRSEAQKLITQVWALYDKQDDATEEDWSLAGELAASATKLEPANAEGWAAYSQATLGSYIFSYDNSPAGFANALSRAQRAVSLASESVEPRFALANCYREQPATRSEGERMLRALVGLRPTDKRILRTLASTLRLEGKFDEALQYYDRAAALPGGDPIALIGKSFALQLAGRFAEAEAALEQSIALRPGPAAYIQRLYYLLYTHDDLSQAIDTLVKVPPAFLLRGDGAYVACRVWLWQRDAAKSIAALNAFTEDFVSGRLSEDDPRAYLLGEAYQLAGRTDAAQLQWRAALQMIDKRLVAQPEEPLFVYWKARLHAIVGERPEAERQLRLYRQLAGDSLGSQFESAFVVALLGRPDEAVSLLGSGLKDPGANPFTLVYRRAVIFHDPALDSLRGQASFEALLAELRRQKAGPSASTTLPAPDLSAKALATVDAKSVAVLAFAGVN